MGILFIVYRQTINKTNEKTKKIRKFSQQNYDY